MLECANVCAEDNLRPHPHRFLKYFFVMSDNAPSKLCAIFRAFGQINRERRTPVSAVLDQKLEREIVHQHAVLDRPDAAEYRVPRALSAISVGRHVALPTGRFGYDGFHVFERNLAERLKRLRINMAKRAR